jgi:hypothetical protein
LPADAERHVAESSHLVKASKRAPMLTVSPNSLETSLQMRFRARFACKSSI